MSESPTAAGPAREAPRHGSDPRLERSLTTPKIVFLVVAAAAPLAAMVATVPLAFAFGDGAGVPAMYAFAGLTLLCFSVGYAAMSRKIVNSGGFYTYVGAGLGRRMAVGSGMIAVIAYNTATVGLLGAFAYFAQSIAASHGLNLPWELWAGAGLALVGFLGYRHIELSAKVLSVFMAGEIGILIALNLAVAARQGTKTLPAVSFSPHTFGGAGLGVGMMFAFVSFIGFESAALYGEESRNPRRSVPLATYVAVVVIALFYGMTSWIAVGGIGADRVGAEANKQLGNLFFNLSDTYLNSAATTVMQVLLCTSLFAGWLALHNAANRYMFVLGRERVLPRALDTVHPKYLAMSRASLVQTAFTALVTAGFAVAGLDPYTSLATSMLGVGTLGIIVLQALASLSVLGFYARRGDRHWWRTITAPVLGVIGLTTATVLLVRNFPTMTGTTNRLITSLPWVVWAAGAGGILYASWLRIAKPAVYADIAQVGTRTQEKTAGADTPAVQPAHREPATETRASVI